MSNSQYDDQPAAAVRAQWVRTPSTGDSGSPPLDQIVLIVASDDAEVERARTVVRVATHERRSSARVVGEVVVSSISDAIVAYTEQLPSIAVLSPKLIDNRIGRGAQILQAVDMSVPVVTLPVTVGGDDLRTVAAVRRALRRHGRERYHLDASGSASVGATRHLTGHLSTSWAGELQRDHLTGLPDRSAFCAALDRLASRSQLSAIAVLAVSLDHFTRVNEGYGQSTGDSVLVGMAERLRAMVPDDDVHLLARVGGDTFALVTDGVGDLPSAHFLAERLATAVVEAVGSFGLHLHPTASTGIALGTSAHGSDLLSHAETALRDSRQTGGHRSTVFDHSLRNRVVARTHLESALGIAIEEEQLRLHYQPIVGLDSGRVEGFEALVRWMHPEDGLLGPDRFIEAAETTGLIRPLGTWVLDTAVRQLDALHRDYPDRGLTVSVNVSARQLDDPDMVDIVTHALSLTSASPSQLCLEITESALLGDAQVATETLHAIRALGVRVALDDFGTGYSSLSLLRLFAIDVLKVDQSFVAGMCRCPEDALVVDAVVHIANRLGFEVVAEGVETDEQCERLLAMGCRLTQGFRWSRPVPPDAIAGVLCAGDEGAYRVPSAALVDPGRASRTNPNHLTDPRQEEATDTNLAASELHEALVVLSHELRTPLHVIHGFAQLLARDLGTEDDLRRSAVEAIIRHSDDMSELVDSLADTRAIETGTLRIEQSAVDLASLVRSTCDDLFASLGDRMAVTSVPPVSVVVSGDARRLRQILTNLLVNAVKFSPEGSPIEITVSLQGCNALVSVIDHGAGVAPGQVADMFRKFSRLGSTRPGTGLGLYLARGLARSHGGDVRYRNTPGGGATFELRLPVSSTS